ncbi:MAG: cell division protein FtsA [Alistipes sp.]|nr:cell division protein FtsA [Alistipes sp.]
MEKKSYIVAVDIGSSEVVIAVGSMNENGSLDVETVVTEPTEGVTAGLVDNNEFVAEALRRAKDKAEAEAGIVITDAYVSISGKFVRCARYTDHVFVEDAENCISQRDVRALRDRMYNVKAADGEVIMDLFPLNYKGDSGVEMKNPVGSYSKQLSSTYNFILCERAAKDRFRRVFLDAGIKVKGMFASAAVVAESVVTTEEKEEGVAIVDIGSGVTDVAVYCGNVLSYIASIPIGGSAINSDIRHFNGYIPVKTIENLKKRYGSAVVTETIDEMILIRKGSRPIKPISRVNLAAVIGARMTDIAEYVWNEIREAGYAKKLGAGIVLTGGVADLQNVALLFNNVTGQEVRVACAEIGVNTESLEKVSSPNKTLAVSMLLRGAQEGACPVGILHTPMPKAAPVVERTVVEPQPTEPQTINQRFGVAAAAAPVAAEPAQQPYNETAQPVPPVSTIATSNEADDYDDEEENDDDIKRGGFSLSGWLSKTFKKGLDNAFRNPDDEDDDY